MIISRFDTACTPAVRGKTFHDIRDEGVKPKYLATDIRSLPHLPAMAVAQ